MTDSRADNEIGVNEAPASTGGSIALTSVRDHASFRQAAEMEELLSGKTSAPVVYSFGEVEPLHPARNPVILGKSMFGQKVPESLMDPAPYDPEPIFAVRFDDCIVHPEWGAVMPSPASVFEPSVRAARWKSPDLTQLAGISLADGRVVVADVMQAVKNVMRSVNSGQPAASTGI